MSAAEEIVKAEELETEQFMALGLGRYEAIRAVEDGIDVRAVEALVRTGYPLADALDVSR